MTARTWDRTLIYGSAVLLALWVLVPFYLIALSAFSRPDDVFVYPKPLLDVITPAVNATMHDAGTSDPAPTARNEGSATVPGGGNKPNGGNK